MVSTSSRLIQRVENAVYHEPYMIPTLFKESNVKAGFLHSRLRRYVPHRVGIEFECFGDFANQYLEANNLKWSDWTDFERYFHLTDFSQDSTLNSRKGKKHIQFHSIDGHEEVRVSISDYRQLEGLYDILKEMAKYCSMSDDCGIHIHIDLTKYDTDNQRSEAVKWFNKHLSEVESIFPRYVGKYNKRVAQKGKGAWVNLSSKGTVEFRIAPLTFDYEVLIVWIVKCSKLVSQMVNECLIGKARASKVDNNKSTPSEAFDRWLDVNPDIRREIDRYRRSSPSIGRNILGFLSRSLSPERYESIEYSIRAMLYNDLTDHQIEWYLRGSDLVLTYPDGVTAVANHMDALEYYLAGGIDGVILIAVREPQSYSSSDSESTRYSTSWRGTMDSNTCCTYFEVNPNELGYYTI